MKNRPVVKGVISDAFKSFKQKAVEAWNELRRQFDEQKEMLMRLNPLGSENLCNTVSSIASSLEDVINTQIEAQTGLSIQRLRYMQLRGYTLWQDYIQYRDRGEAKKKLGEWLDEQDDVVYNAFFCIQVIPMLKQFGMIAKQQWTAGTDIIRKATSDLNDLKDIFDYSYKPKEEREKPEPTTIEDDGDDELHRLIKQNRTEETEDVKDGTHKLLDFLKLLLGLIDLLLPVLAMLAVLFQNRIDNVAFCRQTGDMHVGKQFLDNGKTSGITDTVPVKSERVAEGNPERKLPAVAEGEPARIDNLADPGVADGFRTVKLLPECDFMLVSDRDELPSELDRMRRDIDEAAKDCMVDPAHPLISLSTHSDGGRCVNLRYQGWTKYEIIDAVEAYNGGKRL